MLEDKIDWPQAARMALSIVVNVEEGSEMTVARDDRGMEPVDEMGVFVKSPVRNYANESNYLYGIKAGAPRVVNLLRDYDIAASWTVAAMSLEHHPEIAEAIVALGHEPVAHGWRWVHQFRMDEDEERAFIRKAVASIKATTGTRPYGWLSRYLMTDNTRRLLSEEGFTYHMDDYSRDVPFWDRDTGAGKASQGRPVCIVPYQLDNSDMKMWTNPALTPQQWLDYAKDNFDQVYLEGTQGRPRLMSLGVHLRIIGRPARIWALEEFFKYVRLHDGVWITTRKAIADHFMKANPV